MEGLLVAVPFGDKFVGLVDVGALETNDDRLLHPYCLGSFDHAACDYVAAHDPTENIYQYRHYLNKKHDEELRQR